MFRKPVILVAALAAALTVTVTANATPGGRAASTGVVFVTSQGLYYDTFVTNDPLPMHGKFQLIANGATEFGPGDPGYLGGRWWEDLNGNGVQDAKRPLLPLPALRAGAPDALGQCGGRLAGLALSYEPPVAHYHTRWAPPPAASFERSCSPTAPPAASLIGRGIRR